MYRIFKDSFGTVENDDGESLSPVGYLNGNQIQSNSRPGERASFNEALLTLIDIDECKDDWLATTPGGAGTTPSASLPKDRSTMSSVDLIEAGLKSGGLKS